MNYEIGVSQHISIYTSVLWNGYLIKDQNIPKCVTEHPHQNSTPSTHFVEAEHPPPSGPQQTIMDLPSPDNCIYTIKMESVGRRWRKQKVLAGVCIWKPNKPI